VLESPKGEDLCANQDNAWVHGEPPVTLEGEGYGVGEVIEDFCAPDQFAESVQLHQFYGNVVLLDISTMWCAPCQEIAPDVQPTADDYRDQGFVYVTLLAQDLGSDPPDQAELQYWGDSFGIDEPILSDQEGYYSSIVDGAGFPGILVLGRDMRVVTRDIAAVDADIRAAIEAAL
jgi:thiol-disulfide isomerase/thioredoxin